MTSNKLLIITERVCLQKQSTRKVNLGYELTDKKIRGVMPGETFSILKKLR